MRQGSKNGFRVFCHGQAAVLIFAGPGYILSEPVGRIEGEGIFFTGKFHFSGSGRKSAFKDIQLDGKVGAAVCGKTGTFFRQNRSVGFFQKMGIGLGGKRQVVFFRESVPWDL